MNCFAHDDNKPSMSFNPKTNNETVKCFSCNWTGDIFDVAHVLENLPTSGSEWLSVTIPELCKTLDIPLRLGEPSHTDKERARQHKLTQDIADILVLHGQISKYITERNWTQDHLSLGSIDEEDLMAKLVEKGWDPKEILKSLLVRTRYHSFFGDDKLTFVIRNERSRPVGFISRALNGDDSVSKYINSPESHIYEKGKVLLGLDTALKAGDAKKAGIYIVEGPGDLAQLYRVGVLNAAAVCGTAFTEHHLLLLKKLGIRSIYLSFDWDNAGYIATQRVLEIILKATTGISAHVVAAPENSESKDPDDLLHGAEDAEPYLSLKKLPAFEWQLSQASSNDTPDTICQRMIPIIATESAAVKRELLTQALANFTGISPQAIGSDVSSLRSNDYTERKRQLVASAESYVQEVSEDPDNIIATIAQHEQRVLTIEREYQRNVTGVNYQLSRYDAIQQLRRDSDDGNAATFEMNYYSGFADAFSGGMDWTKGCLMYVGGRSNSGKTATVLALGCDIALSDPNAIVIIHSTDDSYQQIEPRIKSNLYAMANPTGPTLTIGMVVQPHKYLPKNDKATIEAYNLADELFKDLLADERLVILDAEDGSTLSVLERNVKYYRSRFPSKKIMIICDNTHNLADWGHMDQTTRMTMISNAQKHMCVKYRLCMIATAEYRKNMPIDQSKMKLPVDDDLADARALMYRPLAILHVYNDLHDRKDHAEIFWTNDEGTASPRLLINFTKNKISSFKDKLILDLDTRSVTLKPKCVKNALNEAENYIDAKEEGKIKLNGNAVVSIAATEYEM